MKFRLDKANVIFYSIVTVMLMTVVFLVQTQKKKTIQDHTGIDKRVIKCEVPLPNKLIQNMYFMAADLQSAKQMLFNSKQGLFFDNELFIKTVDFNGQSHVVSYADISCDSVGKQVSLLGE